MSSLWREVATGSTRHYASSDEDDTSSSDGDGSDREERPYLLPDNARIAVDLVTGSVIEYPGEGCDEEDDDSDVESDDDDVYDFANVLQRMRFEADRDVERPQRVYAGRPDVQRGGAFHRTVNRVDLNNRASFQMNGSWQQLSDVFNLYGTVYEFAPTRHDSAKTFVENARGFITDVVTHMRENFEPSDQVSSYATGSGFDDSRGGGVGTPFMRLDQFHPNMLMQQLEAIVQSNDAVAFDDGSFVLQMFRVVLPGAGGRIDRSRFMGVMDGVGETLDNKRCLMSIPESMHPYCMVAALWGAKKLALQRVREHRRLFQNTRRVKLELRQILRETTIKLTRQRIDLADLVKLAKTSEFKDHPVVVWSKDHHYSIVAKYNRKGAMPPLYLLLHGETVYIIKSLRSLLDVPSGFFCIECETFSVGKFNHVCTVAYCRACKTQCDNPNAVVDAPLFCDDCHRWFNSDKCFQNHKKKNASPMYAKKRVCQVLRACGNCKRDVAYKDGLPTGKNAYNSRDHVCFKVYCSNCGGHFDPGKHLCHLRRLDPKDPKTREKYRKLRAKLYFYDIETEKVDLGGGRYKFVPICVVLMSEDPDDPTEVFYGEDCLEKLVARVHLGDDSLQATGQRIHLFAHNAAKFDSFLIVRAFIKLRSDTPKILFKGLKILSMSVGRVSWRDSFTYLQCSLARVPKLCGLDEDLVKKGHFPHEFNTPENRNYDGPIPPKDAFGFKYATPDKIAEFEAWYVGEKARLEREGLTYNLKQEMIDYCINDVVVLREGFLKFNENVEKLTGFRCGEDNLTMAGLANLHLRTTIPDRQIGRIPSRGYLHSDVQSRLGLAYLHHLDATLYKGELQMARKNDGEARLAVAGKSIKVDGYHAASKTVIEFAGCIWHGCFKCFTPSTKNPVTGRSLLDH